MASGAVLLLILVPTCAFIVPARLGARSPIAVTRRAAEAAAEPGATITIKYCAGCNWMLRASWVAQELLSTFDDATVYEVTLQPQRAPPGGDFVIEVDGRCVWDRRADGFPVPKDLKRRVRDAIAPDRALGHNDRAAARTAATVDEPEAASTAATAEAPEDWEAEEERTHRESRQRAFGQATSGDRRWGDWTRQSGDVDAELQKLMALGRDAAVRELEGE